MAEADMLELTTTPPKDIGAEQTQVQMLIKYGIPLMIVYDLGSQGTYFETTKGETEFASTN
jgi:hypothetical protein